MAVLIPYSILAAAVFVGLIVLTAALERVSASRFGSLRLLGLAGLLAALDFTVRLSSAAWTESAVAQLAVQFSPAAYIALFAVALLKLSGLPPKLSSSALTWMSVALSACSIAVLAQIFARGRSVGSAGYSEVLPLFVSGVPLALLTFIVFFRRPRGPTARAVVAVVAILWLLMPIGIDTMYVSQGGYRGPSSPFQYAVVGTTYDFTTQLAGYGFLASLLVALAVVLGGIYLAVRSPRWEKLHAIAMSLSLLALSLQFFNWGGFVWD